MFVPLPSISDGVSEGRSGSLLMSGRNPTHFTSREGAPRVGRPLFFLLNQNSLDNGTHMDCERGTLKELATVSGCFDWSAPR